MKKVVLVLLYSLLMQAMVHGMHSVWIPGRNFGEAALQKREITEELLAHEGLELKTIYTKTSEDPAVFTGILSIIKHGISFPISYVQYEHTKASCHISMLRTAGNYQKRGYAFFLLQRLEQQLKNEKIAHIELLALPSARNFYSKRGYVVVPKTSTMEKKLSLSES